MESIREWAEYYKKLKVWVYPEPQFEYEFQEWNGKKDIDYQQVFTQWDLNSSIGLRLMVGRKGVRVVEMVRDVSDNTTDKHLHSILNCLGLPDDYPWIIESHDRLGVIVNTPGVSSRTVGRSNGCFGRDILIWRGSYVLPSMDKTICFYKDRLPKVPPTQISDDVLLDYVENVQKEVEKVAQEAPIMLSGLEESQKRPKKLYCFLLLVVLVFIGMGCYRWGFNNGEISGSEVYRHRKGDGSHFYSEVNHGSIVYHSIPDCHAASHGLRRDWIYDNYDNRNARFCYFCMDGKLVDKCLETLYK